MPEQIWYDNHQQWLEALNASPWQAAEAAESLAELDKPDVGEYNVTVYDNYWRTEYMPGDWIELSGTIPRNQVPSATIKLPQASPVIDAMQDCRDTLVGVTVETQGLRQAYIVDSHTYELQKGKWEGTAQLLGIYDILNYIYVWPTWWLPLQAQPFSHAIYVGNLVMVLENMISENAFRLQSGIWEFVNNALSLNFDMRAWFGTLLQHHGNIFEALKTPIYVVRTNPLFDTSPFVAFTVRMESCAAVIDRMAKAYGVHVTVDLWLPGDPQPDGWANLNKPTYVVRVVDRSGVTGPTGTFLDGIIRTVVDLQGSVLGRVLDPLLNPNGTTPSLEGVFVAPTLGVNFVEPWAVLVDHEDGPLISCKIVDHHPKGHTMIIGGKSPKWLNDLINATLAWLIDSIMIIIGFTGVPSNILDGFMNDAFLAFQMLQNYQRRNDVGPYGRPEQVIPTGSAPYNVESIFHFINAMWDSRGYRSVQAVFRNGEPYALGRDVFPGGLMSVASRGKFFTDYIENVMFRATRKERELLVQIGDGKAEESPLAKQQRMITGIAEAINIATLSPR